MAKAPKAVKVKKSSLKSASAHKKAESKLKEKAIKEKKVKLKSKSKSTEEDIEPSVEDFFNSQIDDVAEEADELEGKKKKKSKSKKSSKEDLENEKEDYKESMDQLAEKDPEFYKYLKENDGALLDFDVTKLSDDEEDEEDGEEEDGEAADEEEEEEEAPVAPKKSKKSKEDEKELTLATIKIWKKSLQEQHSLKTAKKVLVAFREAVTVSESAEEASQFTLTNPEVFNALLLVVLKTVPETVVYNIPLSTSNTGSKYVSTDSKRFKTLSATLRGHASALSTLLADLNDSNIANLVLKSIHTLLPYFLSFRKPLKELVEAVVSLWSSAKDDETRMIAFAFIKTASEEHSKSLLDLVLKSTYAGILRNSRRTNIHTMPGLNFQKNSAATLYGIDPSTAYQQGFQFIRQLAMHLRTSIVSTNKAEAYKAIYNWQYANSLDFWSRVLAVQCDLAKETEEGRPSALRELIYPLVQVTLGAIRLTPTPQYFPLRFYLIRSLLRLSQTTGVYIPLLPLLTEILSSSIITKSPKASTLKALDFDHNIRANKSYIGTRIYQDGVCDELVDLVGEFFVLHSKSIAFPELAVPAIINLRRFTKRSKNAKFNKQIQRLVERLEENAKYIQAKRAEHAAGKFVPTDLDQVAAFLKEEAWEKTPLGSYVVVQRQVKAERAKILRESLDGDDAPAEGKGSDDDVGMSDLEDEQVEEDQEDSDAEMSE